MQEAIAIARKATKTGDNRDINDSINPGYDLNVGVDNPSAGSPNWFAGKLTNFRWDNSAIYTGSSLTVPTSPLTADSDTKLLLLAADTGSLTSDSSPLAKTVTNQSATFSIDSPFTGSVGGSINFAGNSYFTVPQSTDWDL